MAFGGKGWKAGGKTRKIRPSGGNLCSFRHVAGRSVQDCGKVVQKLAGREDENHKLCTTLCVPLRLGTRIVQVSFPLGVRCVGVVVRRCAIRSFSLPPAEAGCPFRRRGRGGRRADAGENARAGAGIALCTSAFAHSDSAIGGQGRGRRQAGAGSTHGQGRGTARGCLPPLPSPSPTLRSAARDTVPQRCELFPTAARTLPGAADGRTIYYIRVRRREGENVLHRAASNDVDNFSVDNPLWITATAGCRSLRGRRRRPCGGSVNAGAEV